MRNVNTCNMAAKVMVVALLQQDLIQTQYLALIKRKLIDEKRLILDE